MRFEDWRDVPAETVAPLYDEESRRWREALGWDLAPSWAIVEDARRAGRLPGLVARGDDGSLTGWSFYVLHEGVLQLGALNGQTAATVRGLLERAIESPEGRLARGFTGFLFPRSSSLSSALERQRFLIARHLYLAAPLGSTPGAEDRAGQGSHGSEGAGLRPLSAVDPADVVRLVARAYAGRPEARCFAPDGRLDQWAHYVGQLLATPAIGRYLPSASLVIAPPESKRPVGAVITTSLSSDTAHIAQVVVDPDCRRSGLARQLLQAAAAGAREAGHDRLTLIVAESNEPARALYARLGFLATASFLYASRPSLTRRSSLL